MHPPEPSPCRRARAACAAAVLAVLAGCAGQAYRPAAIDPPAVQAEWLAADPDDAALRAPMARLGVDTATWPLPAWDADALAAFATLRHADFAAARAALREAEAHAEAARARPLPGIDTTLEHHSADGARSTPWSLAVALDVLLADGARRTAQLEAADALVQDALLQAAQSAWQVRQRVRKALSELQAATLRAEAESAALAQQQAVLSALESRLRHGAADARELLQARLAEAEAAQRGVQAETAVSRARLALAAALQLPAATLARLPLRWPDEAAATPPPPEDLQRAALLNRLDLRAALARYAAADAALRVELTRQWPELTLRPGLAWDQGDRIWSFGLGLKLPPGGDNRGAIAQAEARRAAEGARCLALQREALAALDAARQGLADAAREQAVAARRGAAAATRRERIEALLAAGSADRLDVAAARLADAEARRQRVEADAAVAAARATLEDVLQRPLGGAAALADPIATLRTTPP